MEEYFAFILYGLRNALFYATVGLFIGVSIILLLHFTGSLKREHIALKILTKLYYLYFPLLFFFSFWSIGSIYVTTSTYNKLLLEVVELVEQKVAVELAKSIDQEAENYLKLENLPSNAEIVNNFLGEREDYKNENGIYRYILSNLLIKTLDYSIGKTDSDRQARRTALSSGVASKVTEVGFSALKKEMERQYSRILSFLTLPISFGFILGLILPFIEIIISFRVRQKMKASTD